MVMLVNRQMIRWAKAAFTLILLIVACIGVYLTRNPPGPWTELYTYLFIIPILIASFYYGRVAGLSAALVSSLVTGSLAIGTPDLLESSLVQRLLFQILIFNAVAIVTTELAGRERVLRNRYQNLFEGSPMGLYRTTPNGIIIEVNPTMTRMLGYPDRALLIGMNISGVYLNQEDAKRWHTLMEHDGIVQGLETQFRRYDGTIIWVRDTARAIRDAEGLVQFYDGYVEDITERKQTEDALRESEEFNRNLVENLPDIVAIYDSRGIVRFANRAGLNILGSPLSKVVGEPILSFVTDYQRGELERKMSARLSGAWLTSYEISIRTSSGKIIPAILQGVPIIYKKEPVVLLLMTNITERKQEERALYENEQRLTSIYNTVGDVIFQLSVEPNEQYRFTSVNSAFSRTTGLPSNQVIGKTVNEIIPEPALSVVLEKYRQAIKEKGIVRWEETTNYPVGLVTGEVSIAPIFDMTDSCTFLIGSVHDITERKQAEQKLLEAHRDLEKKVLERTHELSEANIRLQGLDRLKSMFIASMSHELRTPLNSIIGFTGIMIKGMAGEINAEQKKQLGMVQDSARHLLALINDVIDISKIEAGKIEPGISTFNLADVIREVGNTFGPTAQERKIVLNMEIPGPITVTSDERRIKQIIINLVSNAIKFTDLGKIDLTVQLREEVVEVRVMDTGIGIGKEDLEQIFHPFVRVMVPGRLTEGTGLGLYLSKKLARFLGGDIVAESELHKGSVFTFSFPITFEKHEDI
jgi:PAS domain S-box-containing protein